MTVYAFPSITPSSSNVELITNTRTFQSPITGAVQTVGRKGSMWKITMQFNNLKDADRATMKAFLTKLNGQEHRMYLNDHSAQRRGSAGASDTLLVNGASQTGRILQADGAPATAVTSYFKAGDYLSFNNEFHIVTEDVDVSSSGAFSFTAPATEIASGLSYTIVTVGTTDFTAIGASANTVGTTFTSTGVGEGTGTASTPGIPLAPPIRKPTTDNDPIDYALPVFGVFMLASASSWDTQPGLVSNFQIEAVEDVLA